MPARPPPRPGPERLSSRGARSSRSLASPAPPPGYSQPCPPTQGLNNAVALDFDYREQMIYWTDVTTQGSMIRRMHLNGSDVQVRPGSPRPAAIRGAEIQPPGAPPQGALFIPRPSPLLPPTYHRGFLPPSR